MNFQGFPQKPFPYFKKSKILLKNHPKNASYGSNSQGFFQYPPKIFIKNQYINIQNSSRDNYFDTLISLNKLLKRYSKSLTPTLPQKPSPYRKKDRNQSQNQASQNSIKNQSVYDEWKKTVDFSQKKNQNKNQNPSKTEEMFPNVKKSPQKSKKYLEMLFDDSLISRRNKSPASEKEELFNDGPKQNGQKNHRILSSSPFTKDKLESDFLQEYKGNFESLKKQEDIFKNRKFCLSSGICEKNLPDEKILNREHMQERVKIHDDSIKRSRISFFPEKKDDSIRISRNPSVHENKQDNLPDFNNNLKGNSFNFKSRPSHEKPEPKIPGREKKKINKDDQKLKSSNKISESFENNNSSESRNRKSGNSSNNSENYNGSLKNQRVLSSSPFSHHSKEEGSSLDYFRNPFEKSK